MKRYWDKFLEVLTPGVRVLLFVLSACFVAASIGRYSRAFDLYAWLALSPPAFWQGKIWQAATYAFLPAGFVDFLINGFMLTWLGIFLERVWSRKELWLYALLCATGAGVAKALLQPSDPFLLVGSAGAVFGFLVAWGRIYGYDRILLMCLWEMSVRTAAIILGVFSLLLMLPCAGPLNALVLLCGSLTGWLYLTLRWKMIRARPCQTVTPDRIGRLEL